MSELLLCPFCGEAPSQCPSGDGTGVMIECLTPGCVCPHTSWYGEGEAARRWNLRAATASPAEQPARPREESIPHPGPGIEGDWSYTPEQQRVSDYLQSITGGQIGSGLDPIGFLIASHAAINELRREAEAALSSTPQQPSGGWRPDPVEVAKIIDPEAWDEISAEDNEEVAAIFAEAWEDALAKAALVLALPPPPVGEGS